MRRLAIALLCLSLAATACSDNRVRRTMPACDNPGGAAILAAQAIPGVAYVPCVNDLRAGWTYEHLEAKVDEAVFWLHSDRVGSRFLTVTLTPSCNVGNSTAVRTDEPGTNLFMDVRRDEVTLTVTIIPEGTDDEVTAQYAAVVADRVRGTTLRNRLVLVNVDGGTSTTEDRIESALDRGETVFVVGAREQEEGSVELHRRLNGTASVERLDLDDAFETIADDLEEPRYDATWFYTFAGGCVRYEFDARGAGIASIDDEVADSLGMLDVDIYRALLELQGYVLP